MSEQPNHLWKYEEDETLQAVKDYIFQTYQGHYTSKESKTQTLDLLESIGTAPAFCQANIIKYASRFHKKGQEKSDLLKVIHYAILLYHFSGLHKKTNGTYETF
jgi:hypothetical protein